MPYRQTDTHTYVLTAMHHHGIGINKATLDTLTYAEYKMMETP